MRKILFLFILFFLVNPVTARVSEFMVLPVPKRLDTKEDLVKLDNQTMNQNELQDVLARNIYFLELAIAMPFDHPVKALIRITNEQQYQKYQYALDAHIHRRLADQYVQYGNLYYKKNLYFYNDEFLDEYLDGYEIAEFYYKSARIYRRRAMEIAKKARAIHGELNPNRDQSLIDFDQIIYTLTNDPYDFEEVYDKLFAELQENRDKVLALKSKSGS